MRALLVVIALACAGPASAQATRTWVASTGDDSGPCSRSQPCGTFAAALAKTAPAGEIDCVDRGGFGPVTIAKAVTIDCTGSLGGILASSADAVLVNAGAADSVVLRGLSLQGSASSANGIHVAAAGVVVIEGVEINGFGNNGISLQAPNASTSIANVHITNTASSGIFVSPIGGPATASIEHVSIVHTVDGIAVDGSGGITFVTMRDSSISFCATNGALVQAGFGPRRR